MRQRKAAFYCNLEDTRLFGLSPQDFPTFISLVDELAPRSAAVFLDEVQEVADWQRLVRREAIVLCELEEIDYEAAAGIMQCPIGTVRSRLHRGRRLLTEKLAAMQPVSAVRKD